LNLRPLGYEPISDVFNRRPLMWITSIVAGQTLSRCPQSSISFHRDPAEFAYGLLTADLVPARCCWRLPHPGSDTKSSRNMHLETPGHGAAREGRTVRQGSSSLGSPGVQEFRDGKHDRMPEGGKLSATDVKNEVVLRWPHGRSRTIPLRSARRGSDRRRAPRR
jgi:hypothetical protein